MNEEERTRERVLEAAGELFAARGFDGVNVREITAKAGASPAAVNYHFRSKEELYIEAVRQAGRTCDQLWPFPRWAPDTPAEDKLRDFIRVVLGRIVANDGRPAWHRLLVFREVAEPRPGACEEFVRGFIRPGFEGLQAILAELTPPGTDGRTLRMLASSVMGQVLHYQHARHVLRFLLGPDELAALDTETLANHIFRFSLAALKGYGEARP